jgi:hypothetical protein
MISDLRSERSERPPALTACVSGGTAQSRAGLHKRVPPLWRDFRESEGLSITQIVDRIGRTPATVKTYFYDPTGEKAREVKARHTGCASAAPTHPRDGKSDAEARS